MPYAKYSNDTAKQFRDAFASYLKETLSEIKESSDELQGKVKRKVKKTMKPPIMHYASPHIQRAAAKFIHEHDRSIERSARRHKIPPDLLRGILFTELTFSFLPLALDDYLSMLTLLKDKSSSVGPGQVDIKHLKRWGIEGNKWELSWKLHSDIEFSIDATARYIHELIVEYRNEQVEEYTKEVLHQELGIPWHKMSSTDFENVAECMISDDILEAERFEKEAWPDIAKKYNGGDEYKDLFIEHQSKLHMIMNSPDD